MIRVVMFWCAVVCAVPVSAQNAPPAPVLTVVANTRPAVGPAPSWVRAVEPALLAAAPAAAIEVLLNDQQVRLADGGEDRYIHSAFRIGSAEALQAAPVALTWDPALETLTIHRYRLVRDGRLIDLLRDGTGAVVARRELNLEQSALDGRLTASFQPEDVRVGDVVEIAFTQARRDPAMKGRIETVVGLPASGRIERARVRVLWPENATVRYRAYPGFPASRGEVANGLRSFSAEALGYTPPRTPEDVAARHRLANVVEFSNASDWSEVAATFAGFYAEASRVSPGSPLALEIERLRAVSPDPKGRAEAALRVVQDQVRYLFLGIDGGGYRPASAELTWSRRFGDCKGKTTLLLALLRGLGIEARPVLASVDGGDALPAVLPRVGAFNHVLVEARIAGRVHLLDGTRSDDRDLDRMRPPPLHYVLPLAASGAELSKVSVPPLTSPVLSTTVEFDARRGLFAPAPVQATATFAGDVASFWRIALRQLAPTERDRVLKEFWREQFRAVTPEKVGADDVAGTGEYRLTMAGSAKLDWGLLAGLQYWTSGGIGFRFDNERDEELARDAPIAIDHPSWTERRQTILLPGGGLGFKVEGGEVERTVGVHAVRRRSSIAGGRFELTSVVRSLAAELPFSEAVRLEPVFRELGRDSVRIVGPQDYRPSSADLEAQRALGVLATAEAYIQRGMIFGGADDTAAATSDYEAALRLEPDNALALGKLANQLRQQDPQRAAGLARQALAKDPRQWNARATLAEIALTGGRLEEAEREWTAAVEGSPGWTFALRGRAETRARLGRLDLALADADEFGRVDGRPGAALPLRLRVYELAGRDADALRELDQAVALSPTNTVVRRRRAELRLKAGDKPGALGDYEVIVAGAPAAWDYIERAQLWDIARRDRWAADLNAAERLEPGRAADVWMVRAKLEAQAKQWDAALAAIDRAAGVAPAGPQIDEVRIHILRQAGRIDDRGEIALVQAQLRKHPRYASGHNSLCWLKVTGNLELDSAERDCAEALRLSPGEPAFLDSRAFLRLRQRNYRQALEDFDTALRLAPTQAASLYGRSVAKQALGDVAGATSDLAAARRVEPEIDAEFRGKGFEVIGTPRSLASPASP